MTSIRTVWVTRAEPGAARTGGRLAALGLTPVVRPLLTLRSLDVRPDLTGIQALAFTSRNGVKAFVEQTGVPALPVFTVGDATAAAAREAGFAEVRSACGDIHALAALIRQQGRGLSILHPAAAEPAGDLAALVGEAARIVPVAVYAAQETHTPQPDAWDAVLIHSPRAARALAATLPAGAARGRIAVALSPAAAEPLCPLDFAETRIADAPTEDALLAALGKPRTSV